MTTEYTAADDVSNELRAGELLKSARKEKGWSQKEVASQLNLRMALIESMEADQYEANLLPTFIRGYLRSYARLLKIPEQQVLAAYEQHHGNQTIEPRTMHSFSNRTEKEATESRFVLLTYLVGALLLGLLLLWWWQTHWLTDDSAGSTTETAISSTLPAEAVMDTDAESDEMEPEIAATAAALPVQVPSALTALLEVTEANNEAEVTAAEPTADVHQLRMAFSEDCWIDVLDADGSRVAFGTKVAGYQLQVHGRPPFTLTLGNPSAVAIELDGEPVDMSGFRPGRVAKFSIPLQE
ncbi:DUF4115 domain-containing protein [Alkalimonas delamerensis]|uniref:DUF4115 domain-containing protein n=1 Tax=Alkalimonas delamerensis TaxID=265981 RepID=A0ABT9GM74_9GAMM|nr:RodZ domain-containing protein [Alkalimonas delamerensis]MDP4527920.1 DUF4115 domain-containing protein [Alkalimonas delamerensis]